MSMWRVLLSVVALGVVACGEAPTASDRSDEPNRSVDEATVDQEIGLPPSCPSGQSVITWSEPFGSCGGCKLNGVVGQPSHQYAACSGNIPGTKKLIQNLCTTPCELL